MRLVRITRVSGLTILARVMNLQLYRPFELIYFIIIRFIGPLCLFKNTETIWTLKYEYSNYKPDLTKVVNKL